VSAARAAKALDGCRQLPGPSTGVGGPTAAARALDGCRRRPGPSMPVGVGATRAPVRGAGPGPARPLTGVGGGRPRRVSAAARACSALDGCRRWPGGSALDGCRRRPGSSTGVTSRRLPGPSTDVGGGRGRLGPRRVSAAADCLLNEHRPSGTEAIFSCLADSVT
jgi:hypothetical protein